MVRLHVEDGVIRDSSCHWIVGFAKSILSCSTIEAELWGIYKVKAYFKLGMLGVVRLLMQCNSSYKDYTSWLADQSDWLNFGHTAMSTLQIFTSPPDHILSFPHNDYNAL
ncbi:hypothetical protein V6N13_103109 [Hibiscus sabdariffa]|uniref:Uncharacterized protein n=1 Tax=Hibiscus sabdariffa TaxID=183260 RepID=A0ABR2C629_9ROSI